MKGQDAFNQALDHYINKRYKKAESLYAKILNQNPDHPLILFYLGAIMMCTDRHGIGISLFRYAVENQNKFPEAWNNLGSCYRTENMLEEAARCFRKSIAQDSKNPDPYNNLGSILTNDGHPDEGLKFLNKALEIDPKHVSAKWNRALCHLEMEKWPEGWDDYDSGFHVGERPFRAYKLFQGEKEDRVPIWDGSPNKTLVIWGEQGMGDEIMFSSILPEVIRMSKKVIFDCHPRLEDLFKSSFPDIDIYGTRKNDIITWPNDYEIDAKIALGSLGKLFRRERKDFPIHNGYLVPDHTLSVKWKQKLEALSDKPKIGLHWMGGKKKTRNDVRSMPLETLLPVCEQDAEFISFQYTDGAAEEVKAFNEKHGLNVQHWQETVDDYNQTAACVQNLDLVISVCATLIHLSGGLNVPCWILTPSKPAWRYHLKGEKMAWYDSIRMFRQGANAGWEPLVDKVAKELKGFIADYNAKTKPLRDAMAEAAS